MNALLQRLVGHPRYRQMRGKVRAYRCAQIEPDDLEGELNLGILLAMRSVKMDVGDPMEYLLSRGYRHVQSQMSMALNHGVIEECMVCGKQRPYRRNPCATCNSRNFMLHGRMLPLLLNDDGSLAAEGERRRTKSKVEQEAKASGQEVE